MSMASPASDGLNAGFDLTITAGVLITNITISGDVKSDQPANPKRAAEACGVFVGVRPQ
ncbi:MAG: hypothetical protein JO284_13220 [Planctomycetaceae bacterium]|nr:hypothetical protein [Planctomycetaceae bacterium]